MISLRKDTCAGMKVENYHLIAEVTKCEILLQVVCKITAVIYICGQGAVLIPNELTCHS